MSTMIISKHALAAQARDRLPALQTVLHSATRTMQRIASNCTALRIDVQLPPDELERELAALHHRLNQGGNPLHSLPTIHIEMPGLLFRYRIADGEHYVYVEDCANQCLAGYTVFNRLIELNRQQDRHLRATHSRYASKYQRRGIASAIYRWWLDGERCLISGARQSLGANALWHALSRDYDLVYVRLRDKTLSHLGTDICTQVREDLHTRMILLGRQWTLQNFGEVAGMALQEPGDRDIRMRKVG